MKITVVQMKDDLMLALDNVIVATVFDRKALREKLGLTSPLLLEDGEEAEKPAPSTRPKADSTEDNGNGRQKANGPRKGKKAKKHDSYGIIPLAARSPRLREVLDGVVHNYLAGEGLELWPLQAQIGIPRHNVSSALSTLFDRGLIDKYKVPGSTYYTWIPTERSMDFYNRELGS